jgi:hypothetical protein
MRRWLWDHGSPPNLACSRMMNRYSNAQRKFCRRSSNGRPPMRARGRRRDIRLQEAEALKKRMKKSRGSRLNGMRSCCNVLLGIPSCLTAFFRVMPCDCKVNLRQMFSYKILQMHVLALINQGKDSNKWRSSLQEKIFISVPRWGSDADRHLNMPTPAFGSRRRRSPSVSIGRPT